MFYTQTESYLIEPESLPMFDLLFIFRYLRFALVPERLI